MEKKESRWLVKTFIVLTVLIMIAMVVLGVNLLKNRWHRLNFIIDSVEASELDRSESEFKYRVCVKGSAKTWFYDFNTYEFDLAYFSSGNIEETNARRSDKITVTHSGSNEFEFEFDINSLEDFGKYIYHGEHIYIDGSSKEGTEIKLFLSEYTDMLTLKQ